MNSTTIKIDGAKLRELLESKTGKTIYKIAQESGYSKNVISNAIRQGYASSAVQNIARLYDITPDEYKVIERVTTLRALEYEEEQKLKQLSIDDLNAISREELKALIKETILETLSDFKCKDVKAQYDPCYRVFKIELSLL